MKKIYSLVAATAILASSSYAEESKDGLSYKVNDRLRHEGVSQDNTSKDATALTNKLLLGTGYKKGSLSAYVELTNIAAFTDTYKDTAGNGANYSVVKDPAQSRLTQAKLMYKSKSIDATVGRDMYTLDGHRFIGDVAWRQMPQTFDVAALNYEGIDKLEAKVAYVFGRHTVGYYDNLLATEVGGVEQANSKTNSILANANYTLNDDMSLRFYDYMISSNSDTIGTAIIGKTKSFGYKVELAAQMSASLQTAGTTKTTRDTQFYSNIELNKKVSGMKLIASHETLGGDGTTSFYTPWATLHKFNGWADAYLLGTPANGLADLSLGAVYKSKDMGTLKVFAHLFSDSDYTNTQGMELDAVYVYKIQKGLVALVKASVNQADTQSVDTTKMWASIEYTLASK